MAINRDPFGRAVGNRLKFRRDEAGMSTAELAERLHLTEFAVRRHLRGENLPDVRTMARYADLLGVGVDDLLPGWAPWDSNPQPTDSGLGAAAA